MDKFIYLFGCHLLKGVEILKYQNAYCIMHIMVMTDSVYNIYLNK